MSKVYEIITERIIEMLKHGVCPWRRPWNLMPNPPKNFASGRPYHGINHLMLSMVCYEMPLFLTFNQITDMGGKVKKGSKGLPVVFWSTFESDELDEAGKPKKIPFLRYYVVFNATQIDGIQFPKIEGRSGAEFKPIALAENVLKGWTTGPRIQSGFSYAGYLPEYDLIRMPIPTSFDSPADYYSTLFHELAHATGHDKRLGRKLSSGYVRENYSKEELVAEMTSAFLCAHCGIDNSTIKQQAAYIGGWLKALNDDPKLVVLAAAQAQKAANLILGLLPAVTGDQVDQAA